MTSLGFNMMSLLHVEDNELDARALARALKKLDLTVPINWARDGVEALEILRGKLATSQTLRHTVVLLDINMPRMNGIEFLSELRQDEALHHIPVVVLTTSDKPSDIREAYAHNVTGYIVKPLGAGQLADKMRVLAKYLSIVELPRTS